ncbi:hypothetical protein Dimus_024168 [Dionaea muscipula]
MFEIVKRNFVAVKLCFVRQLCFAQLCYLHFNYVEKLCFKIVYVEIVFSLCFVQLCSLCCSNEGLCCSLGSISFYIFLIRIKRNCSDIFFLYVAVYFIFLHMFCSTSDFFMLLQLKCLRFMLLLSMKVHKVYLMKVYFSFYFSAFFLLIVNFCLFCSFFFFC